MESHFTLIFFSVLRLIFATGIFFFWLPRKVFPQEYIDNSLDRVMFNCIHMVAIITLIFPIFIFFKVFGFPFLILFFIVLRFLVLKYWYKIELLNYIEHEIYHNSVFFVLRTIENYRPLIFSFREKIHGAWLSTKAKATWFNALVFLSAAPIIFYLLFIRLLGPFSSLVAAVSDMYQYYYWNQILKVNTLFDKVAGAPYPWGSPVLVYTVNLLSKMNTIVIYNTFPLVIISFWMFTIYYVIKKFFDRENLGTAAFLIAILLFGIVIPSPLAENFFGTVFDATAPSVSRFWFLKFYFEPLTEDTIIATFYPIIFFIRFTTTLPYEFASAFMLPSLYFLHKALVTRRAVFFFIYAECLAIISALHGAVLVPLFIPSLLITINSLINCGTDKKTLKTGIAWVSTAFVIGNLWMIQMFKYGIPGGVGAAAPIIDTITRKQHVSKLEGAGNLITSKAYDSVQMVTYEPLMLVLVLSSIALIVYFCFKSNSEERSVQAVIPLMSLAYIFIYYAPNMGLPRIVDHSRLQTSVALSFSLLSAQYYHLLLEKMIFRRFFRARAMLVSFALVFVVAVSAILLTPRWIDEKIYWESVISMELKETPYFIYQIEEKFQPLTYTIVSYGENFSQILSLGYHTTSQGFLAEYSPLDEFLKLPTEFVFIVVENMPVTYHGGGEYWYRWRGEIMSKIKDWIVLYGQNHSNMKLWVQTDQLQIYIIDNRIGATQTEKDRPKVIDR